MPRTYRVPRSLSVQVRATSTGRNKPPEVVMNDMDPAGQQHLSLSKTTVLRAHQIEPFVEGLKQAVKSSRRWGEQVFLPPSTNAPLLVSQAPVEG